MHVSKQILSHNKKTPNFKAFINKRQLNSSAIFNVSKATVVLTSCQRIPHSTADFHPKSKDHSAIQARRDLKGNSNPYSKAGSTMRPEGSKLILQL